MERHNGLGGRALAVLLLGFLGSMVLLGGSSSPPIVEISDIFKMESGTEAELIGILVEARVYDSGADGLVLADLDDGSTVKVVCSKSIRPQPSSYVSIGDELRVVGEVSSTETGTVVFTGSDRVSILRESEAVLTVRTISSNWALFEGDTIRINGILRNDGFGTGPRLADCSGGCSIAVSISQVDLGGLIDRSVVVTATVEFDHRTSSLVLLVLYAIPEP